MLSGKKFALNGTKEAALVKSFSKLKLEKTRDTESKGAREKTG
jgi:hypothetical protein